ncbi:MAG TPA: lytic murein transglycosylase, partial [Halomonas sp.]|nr:lytic murein transglycosylase [Halomonas sp.]
RAAEEVLYANFNQWLSEFRRYAANQGISEATLASAFDGLRYRERVIELDRYQPEFVRAIWQYLDSAVSTTRITNGQEKYAQHRETAQQMQQRYGVPAEIIVAIWGVESNYGSNFGDFSTLESLATLAYDGRRRDFASSELLAALRIIDQGDIAAEQMKGSWAGAMGHTQFIPSSFEAYAVDGDGDGRRDIWGSIPDVMASTAN